LAHLARPQRISATLQAFDAANPHLATGQSVSRC
jgi:hypothetical protein